MENISDILLHIVTYKIEPVNKSNNFFNNKKNNKESIEIEKKPKLNFDKLLKESLEKLDNLEEKITENNDIKKVKKNFSERYDVYLDFYNKKKSFNLDDSNFPVVNLTNRFSKNNQGNFTDLNQIRKYRSNTVNNYKYHKQEEVKKE